MANAVLNPSGGLFPAGTTSYAHRLWEKSLGRAPSGTPAATAIVSDQGTLTFIGLLPATLYTAYAVVAGEHRYIDFQTDDTTVAGDVVDLGPINADIAALSTRVGVLETFGATLPDASTATKGSTKLSVAPVDPANPIAVGDNDARLDSLVGIAGETFRAGPTESSVLAALAAARANNGGKVEAHAIGYEMTELWEIPPNTWLECAGHTILRQANGANLPVLMASDGWADLVPLSGTANYGDFRHSRLTGFAIDGNYENNLTEPTLGLGIYGIGWELELVRIMFCRGLGLHTDWGALIDPSKSPTFDREPATEGFYDWLRISDCINGGFYFNGPNDPIIKTLFGVRNGHGGNPAMPTGDPTVHPGSGFNVKFGPNAVAPICSDWHLWGNSLWHLYLGDQQGGEFSGVQIEGGGNTSGAGGCVYYNCPGSHFIGGRIFTGTVGAGWIDSKRGIVFGPSGFNLKLFGTVFDNGRPAFDFTAGGGANSWMRGRWSADGGSMIAGTPDDSIVWDMEDMAYAAGIFNLPQNAKRVMIGYQGQRGGGKILSAGSHTLAASGIAAVTELAGAAPVVTLPAVPLTTIPLGSSAKFTHRGTGTATFAGDAGGSQQFGKTGVIGTYDGPAPAGYIVGQKVTAIAGSIFETAAWLTVISAGAQDCRMAVYADSAGAPGALLGSSDTVSVDSTDVGGIFFAQYVEFPWSTPLAVSAGPVHLAIHFGATAGIVREGYSLGGDLAGWLASGTYTFASGAPASLAGVTSSASGDIYLNASVPAPVAIRSRSGLVGLAQYATAEVYRSAFAEYVLSGELS